MELNKECVRDLLIAIEENVNFDDDLKYPAVSLEDMYELPILSSHRKEQIAYTTLKLEEADLISASIISAGNAMLSCIYSGLTYDGHVYLDSIRSDTVWKRTTEAVAKIGGSVALPVLVEMAKRVALNLTGLS